MINSSVEEISDNKEKFVVNVVNATLQKENINQALEYLESYEEELTERKFHRQYAFIKLCHVLREINAFDKALVVGEYLYKHFPQDESACVAYATVLGDKKEFKTGIDIIKKITGFRQRKDFWMTYCYLLQQDEQLEEAIKEYKQLIKAFPDNTKILYAYSLTLEHNENYSEQKKILREILRIKENHWKALTSLAYALREYEEDFKGSIEILEKALNVAKQNIPIRPTKTDFAKMYHQLGLCYSKLLDMEKAAEYFQMAIDTDASYGTAFSGLEKSRHTDKHFKPGGANQYSHRKGKTFNLLRPRYEKKRKSEPITYPQPKGNLEKVDRKDVKIQKPANQKTYNSKITELEELRTECKTKFGEAFEKWFGKTFEYDSNLGRGPLLVAKALAESNNYFPAINKLNTILSEIRKQIDNNHFVPIENTSSKDEIEISNTVIEQHEPNNDATVQAVPQTQDENNAHDTGNLTVSSEQNTEDHGLIKTSKAGLWKFWQLFSDCCPPFHSKKPNKRDSDAAAQDTSSITYKR